MLAFKCVCALFKCINMLASTTELGRQVNVCVQMFMCLGFGKCVLEEVHGWRRGVVVTELVVSTKLLYVEPG